MNIYRVVRSYRLEKLSFFWCRRRQFTELLWDWAVSTVIKAEEMEHVAEYTTSTCGDKCKSCKRNHMGLSQKADTKRTEGEFTNLLQEKEN